MKKTLAIFLSSLFLFFSSPLMAADKVRESKGVIVANQYLEAAKEIPKKINDVRINSVVEYLTGSHVVLAPSKNRHLKVVSKYGRKPKYGILPLFDEDKEKSPAWKKLIDEKRCAITSGEANNLPIIVIKGNNGFSRLWKGLLLFHQGARLTFGKEGLFDDVTNPPLRKAVEEFTAYELEMDILSAYGGDEYAKLLDQEVGRIEKLKGESESIPSPNYRLYKKELTKLFGRANSKMETTTRQSILWLHAVYTLIDRKLGAKILADDEKIQFMMNCYANGML